MTIGGRGGSRGRSDGSEGSGEDDRGTTKKAGPVALPISAAISSVVPGEGAAGSSAIPKALPKTGSSTRTVGGGGGRTTGGGGTTGGIVAKLAETLREQRRKQDQTEKATPRSGGAEGSPKGFVPVQLGVPQTLATSDSVLEDVAARSLATSVLGDVGNKKVSHDMASASHDALTGIQGVRAADKRTSRGGGGAEAAKPPSAAQMLSSSKLKQQQSSPREQGEEKTGVRQDNAEEEAKVAGAKEDLPRPAESLSLRAGEDPLPGRPTPKKSNRRAPITLPAFGESAMPPGRGRRLSEINRMLSGGAGTTTAKAATAAPPSSTGGGPRPSVKRDEDEPRKPEETAPAAPEPEKKILTAAAPEPEKKKIPIAAAPEPEKKILTAAAPERPETKKIPTAAGPEPEKKKILTAAAAAPTAAAPELPEKKAAKKSPPVAPTTSGQNQTAKFQTGPDRSSAHTTKPRETVVQPAKSEWRSYKRGAVVATKPPLVGSEKLWEGPRRPLVNNPPPPAPRHSSPQSPDHLPVSPEAPGPRAKPPVHVDYPAAETPGSALAEDDGRSFVGETGAARTEGETPPSSRPSAGGGRGKKKVTIQRMRKAAMVEVDEHEQGGGGPPASRDGTSRWRAEAEDEGPPASRWRAEAEDGTSRWRAEAEDEITQLEEQIAAFQKLRYIL